MAAAALVQTRIDPAVRDKAAEVPDGMGMTASDAVRILLTRVAKEGALVKAAVELACLAGPEPDFRSHRAAQPDRRSPA